MDYSWITYSAIVHSFIYLTSCSLSRCTLKGWDRSMKRKHLLKYGLVIAFVVMAFLYTKTYKENLQLKSQLGTDNQNVVINLSNLLTYETSTEYWLEQLEKPEGHESLRRLLGEMDYLSFDLYMSNMPEVAEQLDILKEQFYQLKKEGHDLSPDKLEELEENISFLTTLLTTVRSDLGEDSLVWFKNIHDDSSMTQKYIRNEITFFRNKAETEK